MSRRPSGLCAWTDDWLWDIWARGELPGACDRVLAALARHANREGIAWPSIPTLADLTGRSKASVHRALEALEERGLIEPAERRRAGRITRWRLIPEAANRSAQSGTVGDADRPATVPQPFRNRSAQSGTATEEEAEEEGVHGSATRAREPHQALEQRAPRAACDEQASEGIVGPVPDPQPEELAVPSPEQLPLPNEEALRLVALATDALFERRFPKPDYDEMVRAAERLAQTVEFRNRWITDEDLLAALREHEGDARSWRAFLGSEKAVRHTLALAGVAYRRRTATAAPASSSPRAGEPLRGVAYFAAIGRGENPEGGGTRDQR